MSFSQPNILVCPLDWGLGHATRCIPLIRKLSERKANVILAADNRPLILLKQEFPGLQFIRFPGYRFSYPSSGNMALKMFMQSPQLFAGIKKEHDQLEKLVETYEIDAVISDNRFGLYSKKVPSVFMSHQIFIRPPRRFGLLKPLLHSINMNFIRRFSECWIPDFKGTPNLSGELSHLKSLNDHFHYIGPQSRFYGNDIHPVEKKYDLLLLLSGPEPQRTFLEEKFFNEIKNSDLNCAVVLGTPEKQEYSGTTDRIHVFTHLQSKQLKELILQSEWVISRPGYSTIMDLAVLGSKAIFIPTTGQTEQEYLAQYFSENGIYFSIRQREFNPVKTMNEVKGFEGMKMEFKPGLLDERIDHLLEYLG